MIYTTYKYKLDKGDADDDYPMPFFKVKCFWIKCF